MRKSPVVRFPEFSEEWEEHRIGDVIKISSGGTPDRGTDEFWNGDIPWVTTALIDFEKIVVPQEYITDLGLENSSAKKFPVGTVLIAMYGQGKTRGKVGILGIEATTNQACAALLPDKERVNEGFLFQYLAGRYGAIRRLSNSGGQDNLSAQIIKTFPLAFPSLPEQQRIVAFLSAVDEKIRQLVRKKKLILKYKKGVMQQIFNQKIRFKDGNGNDFPDWEEKDLGAVTTSIRNGLSLDQESDERGVPVTRIETISDGTINMEKVGFVETDEDVSDYRLQIGDILFSNINSVAHIGKMAYVDKEYGLYHGMNLLNIRFDRKRHNSQFFYFLMETIEYKKHFQRICNRAVSQASINQTDLKETKLIVPCLAEQSRIASFLSAIDKKICYLNQELESTNTFKTGLHQQMFLLAK